MYIGQKVKSRVQTNCCIKGETGKIINILDERRYVNFIEVVFSGKSTYFMEKELIPVFETYLKQAELCK